MKIAFDLRRIKNPGIGRYVKCLTEAVLALAPEHEYLLVLPPDAEEMIAVQNGRVEKICPSVKYYSVREQVEIPRILRRYRVDLLHSPHFNLPLVRACPTVVTIHDVIYLACKQDLPSRIGRFYYHGMMAASVRLADRVLTDSEFSKRDIIRYLHADPAKIEVIYPGVDPRFQRMTERTTIEAMLSRYHIDEDYILYTGIYKLRKNHAGLLRAFRQLLKNGEKSKLVIAGPMGEGEAELRRLAGERGVLASVMFIGFFSDSYLPLLHSAAPLDAFPPFYVGF